MPLSPDSKAIVDGNLKLILGLVWTLILHYSISMPVWEDEGDDDAKKQTPKQRLLGWIQNKIPYLPITNFNQNWQDGKALGALVDSCAPGKCPWLPEPALQDGDLWAQSPLVVSWESRVCCDWCLFLVLAPCKSKGS